MNHWSEPSRLDRLAEHRSAEAVAGLWPGALVLEVDAQGRFAARNGAPIPLPDPGASAEGDVLLGNFEGKTWFARPVDAVTAAEPIPWRETDPEHRDLTAAAVALLRWHLGRPRCEKCGEVTVPDSAGARRRCPACATLAFPRHDPAVIVAVLDPEDRLLLGRQAAWEPGRCSVIAGFVEAGESLEQAVWREVAEEVGIQLSRVRYVASQPWPMPRSLMLGFVAAAADGHVEVDGTEIMEARYWERAGLRAALADGNLILPGGASIARFLVDSWLAGNLPRP